MSCPQTQDLVHAYLDGELSLTEQLNFEQHLSTCPHCQQAYRAFQLLHERLHDPALRFELPEKLRRQLQETSMPGDSVWRFILPRAFAIAAVVAIVILAGVSLWLSRTNQNSLSRELVDAHIRSMQADHLTDVTSTDQHTVKPWFDGKVDFSPPVMNLAAEHFPLLGGRLDYLRNHPTAALVYRRDKHLINVFIWPESGPDQVTNESMIDGYNVIQWRRAGMHEAAVSDLNMTELRQLVGLLY